MPTLDLSTAENDKYIPTPYLGYIQEDISSLQSSHMELKKKKKSWNLQWIS